MIKKFGGIFPYCQVLVIIYESLILSLGSVGKNVFWIDATFKAVDLDLNISGAPQCITWQRFWEAKNNSSNIEQYRLLKVGI